MNGTATTTIPGLPYAILSSPADNARFMRTSHDTVKREDTKENRATRIHLSVLDALKMILVGNPLNEVLTSVTRLITGE